jgi:anti-sigma28 factor (negative regulator of flagellin synthesis)
MSIRNIGNPYGPGRPAPAAPIKAVPSPSATPSQNTTPQAKEAPAAARRDSVQLSAAGRALAGGVDGGAMSAERVAELRKKVLEGAYNSTEVVDQVAKRILGSGDV